MKKVVLSFLLLNLFFFVNAQKGSLSGKFSTKFSTKVVWQKFGVEKISENHEVKFFRFIGAQYETDKNFLPFLLVEKKNINNQVFVPELKNIQSEIIFDQEEISLANLLNEFILPEFSIEFLVREARQVHDAVAKIIPLRRNSNGQFEKLISFDIDWNLVSLSKKNSQDHLQSFASSSVLAAGNWLKVGLTQSGVYKLDYNYFKNILGLNVDSLDPRTIRVYGNGGFLLPESNSVYRPDDLQENAIYVSGEADGKFDITDYVLFYGQSPTRWAKQASSSCIKFKHVVNIYSDSSYYFITTDLGSGKRIQQQASNASTSNIAVNTFDDYAYYENNSVNLIHSGKEWYGEYFDVLSTYTFNFDFPNIVANDSVLLDVALANRMGSADANAYTVFYPSGSMPITSQVSQLANYTAPYAYNSGAACKSFLSDGSPSISITITKNNSNALGWLNYIRLNARRQLVFSGLRQLLFRDTRSVGLGNISLFSVGSAIGKTIWETTDIYNIKEQLTFANGTNVEFAAATDSLRQFVVFSLSSCLTPVFSGVVLNQNLHSYFTQHPDVIMIVHPDFLTQAQRLAQHHTEIDNLVTVIVTPQQVYNEFSSGSQDIVALRDFVRSIYSAAVTNNFNPPRFLTLFGDGSYRYKSYGSSNTNYVPTYQSFSSLEPTSSYTSDDFYGLMDDSEGDFTSDAVDLGVGRIPAKTVIEAAQIVDKIFEYTKSNGTFNSEISACNDAKSGPMGDWRNTICFIADDEDGNLHLSQADSLATNVSRNHPSYNINKIYLDSYTQTSTPGGKSYPDVNTAIDNQVEKGCLIINYTGHGGEVGLAHESILTVSQILGYKNFDRLPLWFTATCEFSRYDDPDRTSAGEYVLLNAKGGGIALFSTVRLVYAQSNFDMATDIWQNYMLDSINSEIPFIGEIFMRGKQDQFAVANIRNFTLLGDPALKLAYPRNVVRTDSINGVSTNFSTDTLKALSKITVKGHIQDAQGNKLTSFNGIIYPIVYDKYSVITTLQNDIGSPSTTFKLQKNIIYSGKSIIANGDFSFTFIVPKDISYNYGFGKISYYAHNGIVDGAGSYEKIVVGGSNPNAIIDNLGPTLKLFLNDDKFVFGGTTNENPKLFAELIDSSGINTVGSGIGHDIVATLDENSTAPIVLNDYYQADLNKYQSGKVLFSLTGLPEGTHKLSLKAWDVQNNSSTAYTEFVVAKAANLALNHVLNYPNPFSTHTQFFLEHNNCCSQIQAEIDIFTISGKVVKSISKILSNNGFRSEGIEWDGTDEFGDKLGKGVYIYKVKIKDNEGKLAEKFEKLVILN